MAKIAVISGSPTANSRLNGVLQSILFQLAKEGFDIETIDVRTLPPEDLIYTRFDSPAIVAANEIIAESDAVVVATPIYKASYTGVIKTFLDLIPQKGLLGKAVLPVAIGGSSAHLLALDYALKPVLSVLGARVQLAGVYAVDSQVARHADGTFEIEAALEERLVHSTQELIREVRLRAVPIPAV